MPTALEGESTRGELPLSLGGLPRKNFDLLALLCAFLMGFYAFGTRFQSRFFARKDISCINKLKIRGKHKEKKNQNEKKGTRRKAYSSKKWSGARRPAGPATTALCFSSLCQASLITFVGVFSVL